MNPVAQLQLQGALAKLKRGRNTLPPKVITPDMYAPPPEEKELEKVPFKRVRVMHTTTPRTTPRPDEGEVGTTVIISPDGVRFAICVDAAPFTPIIQPIIKSDQSDDDSVNQ